MAKDGRCRAGPERHTDVRVADTACQYSHDHVARTRVGNRDLLDLDRYTVADRNDRTGETSHCGPL